MEFKYVTMFGYGKTFAQSINLFEGLSFARLSCHLNVFSVVS